MPRIHSFLVRYLSTRSLKTRNTRICSPFVNAENATRLMGRNARRIAFNWNLIDTPKAKPWNRSIAAWSWFNRSRLQRIRSNEYFLLARVRSLRNKCQIRDACAYREVAPFKIQRATSSPLVCRLLEMEFVFVSCFVNFLIETKEPSRSPRTCLSGKISTLYSFTAALYACTFLFSAAVPNLWYACPFKRK